MRKILCLRLRSMGDGVLMTPSLRALRHGFAGTEIHVVLERPLVPLFEKHPDIDKIHALDGGILRKLALTSRLRNEGFDAVINFHGGPTSAWMTKATGAKRRVGLATYRFRNLYNVHAPPPHEVFGDATAPHTVHIQASLVAALGMKVEDLSLHLEISETARTSLAQRLENLGLARRGYVVFQPTASFVSKQWPAERYMELARKIKKRSGREVLATLPDSPRLGRVGPGRLRRLVRLHRRDDHSTSNSIADIERKLSGEIPIFSRLPLSELAALMEGASIYIGNDSGPMHIAAALGTPVVVIFGSSDPQRWRPWGVEHRTIWAGLECSPCHGKWCANPERHACLDKIEVSRVLDACLDLLESKKNGDKGIRRG